MTTENQSSDNIRHFALALGFCLVICAIICQIIAEHTDLYANPLQHILAELGAGLLGVASAAIAATIIIDEVLFRWDNRRARI